jgi:hypothetical protein
MARPGLVKLTKLIGVSLAVVGEETHAELRSGFSEVCTIDQLLKPQTVTVSFLKLKNAVMGCCLRARIRHA